MFRLPRTESTVSLTSTDGEFNEKMFNAADQATSHHYTAKLQASYLNTLGGGGGQKFCQTLQLIFYSIFRELFSFVSKCHTITPPWSLRWKCPLVKLMSPILSFNNTLNLIMFSIKTVCQLKFYLNVHQGNHEVESVGVYILYTMNL
jgi:hypothetical protein